jgi:hypothetical protein
VGVTVTDISSLTGTDALPAVPFGLRAAVGPKDDGSTRSSRQASRAGKEPSGDKTARVRRPVRLHPDTDQRAQYWANKHGISENAYIEQAVEEKIRRENGDYDLPTLEIARLAQLIDHVASLSTNVANLERVTVTGFDSLMGLTRGDNYLLDPEDGELGEARG